MNRRNFFACLVGSVVLRTADALGVVSEEPLLDHGFRDIYQLADPYAPRWNFSGGEWIRVPSHKLVNVVEDNRPGVKAVENPEYHTAEYEDVVWLSEDQRGSFISRSYLGDPPNSES